MLIHKGFRYRAYPSPAAQAMLARWFGCARVVHNLGLDQHRMFSRKGRSFGYTKQTADLPTLKAEFPWLAECFSQCLQQALKDLDHAFQCFFTGQGGYPRPWKKFEDDSLRFPQMTRTDAKTGEVVDMVALTRDGIHFPGGLGFIPVCFHRPLEGTPKHITLQRQGLTWWVSVCCEIEVTTPRPLGHDTLLKGFTGVDFGVANAYTRADGHVYAVPGETDGEAKRRLRLERRIARAVEARKAYGRINRSRREMKLRESLRALDQRVRRRRDDALHKITSDLAQNHGLIGIEDLRIATMTASARGSAEAPGRKVAQKAGLNRGLLGNAFGKFRRMLTYKAGWYGAAVVAINPARTSQTCSECHRHPKDSPETAHLSHRRINQAEFACPLCGFACHADVNAARNIERLATREFIRRVDSGESAAKPAPAKRKKTLSGLSAKPKASPDASRTRDQDPAGGRPVAARGARGVGQAKNRDVSVSRKAG